MDKKKLLCLCLYLIAGIAISNAQKNLVDFIEYDLENGLHVILYKDNTVPIVNTTVYYKVGSKDENPERTGFAHFFEHLMFEGSENIKRGQFDDLLENAGAANNAFTTNDQTVYFETLPSNQLELALWMESERLLHAKIDSVGIETQREVVKEEKRQRVDNQPYGTWQQEIMKRAYTKHPYRWMTIGSLDHLNAASNEEFIAFYKKFYVPNNAILVIAGDIDYDNAKAMVNKYFSDIPKGAAVPRVTIKEPAQTAEIRDTIYDNIQLPAVFHGFKTPGRTEKDYYGVSMLMQLLSRGASSRLNKSVRDEKQLAVQVAAAPFSLEQSPSISIALALANAGVDPGEMEKAMIEEYEKVKSELIPEKEFQKLRNQVENDFYSGYSSVSGVATTLAENHAIMGNTNLINTEIENYLSVTREDILELAKRYLVPENRVTLFYLPKSAEEAQ